ncbi:MAG: hypothetical protein ACOY93_13605 [Bacillota bacterium]
MKVDWTQILQWLNTAALVVFAYLLARGYLVPMPVVEQHMLAPRDERIQALERVSSKKDEQHAELQRMMAAAIEAQSKALEYMHGERGRQ